MIVRVALVALALAVAGCNQQSTTTGAADQAGPQLDALRRRFVLMTYGAGRWENPAQTWRMAEVLGGKGVPNRVVPWGPEWDHDWVTWRAMLPIYLDELVP